ncbi:MAG: hypothetical protein JNL35_11615 [Sphingopyxis sp.]|nr:hypothetical protein [Sphingopyxis sp.]
MALVAGWAWWEYSHYAGLYRWLAEWQIAKWGGYEQLWTALVPAFILTIPSLRVLRERELLNQASLIAGDDPVPILHRVRTGMLVCSVILALVAGGAYFYSQTLPDPSDPPATVDLAALGDKAPPAGSAIFAGAVPDTDRALQMEEAFRSRSADIDHQTIYVPVVAENAAKHAPVRFFIDRANYAFADSGEAPRTNICLADHMQGVLVENGLPADVVAAFAKQSVSIARARRRAA